MKWWMHMKKVVVIGLNACPHMHFGTSVLHISPVITTVIAHLWGAWDPGAYQADGQTRVPMITWFVKIEIMIMMMNKAKVHE